MLNLLLRIRMQSLLYGMFQRSTRGKKKTGMTKAAGAGFALLMVYCVAVFVMMFGMLFQQLAQPFHALGLDWLYFSLAGLIALSLMFVGSVFTTKSQLYEAKDNELLLSMPVPPRSILLSRMLLLMAVNLFFELIIVLPAGVIYAWQIGASLGGTLCFILIFLLLPLLAFALDGLFGWLLALATARVRNKSLLSVAFGVAFLGAYFYVFSKVNVYIQLLVTNSQSIADTLRLAAPVYWLGNAIASGSPVHLLLTLLVLVIPFLLVFWILSASFTRIATTKRSAARIRYQEKAVKSRSALSAYTRKELRHFFSSPGYVMNCGLGIIFLLIAAVALVVKRDLLNLILQQVPFLSASLPVMLSLALCMMLSMTLITAPSISLEGKSLWIAQSMPMSPQTVLRAKCCMGLLLTLPVALLSAAVCAWAIQARGLALIGVLLVPALFSVFTTLLGVVVNLRHPRMEWISETQVVKQSISVMLCMLYAAAVVFAPGLLYLLALNGRVSGGVFLLLYALLLAVACAALLCWINRRGAEVFQSLNS